MKKLSTFVIISLIQLYNTSTTALALCNNFQNDRTSRSSSSRISSTTPTTSRHVFLKKHLLTSAAGTAAAAAAALLTPSLSNAAAIEKVANEQMILRSDKCAFGEGEGCSSLAGDNEFIKELQRRSKEKKELAQKEYLSAYQMKNYPDFFASLSPPKYMVKKSDGTFELFDDAQLAELKKANRIKLEKPTAMGGKVQDYTQKPILVLVD